jgi:glutathione synthase/RimK-type ligase-like ATP-grasp enzyme
MATRLGVVMDPIARISYKKDSTLAMLWAAADRGWELYYMEPRDLALEQGAPVANMAPLQVFRDPQRWYALGEASRQPLESLDVVLMRRDPPFENEYVLRHLHPRGRRASRHPDRQSLPVPARLQREDLRHAVPRVLSAGAGQR